MKCQLGIVTYSLIVFSLSKLNKNIIIMQFSVEDRVNIIKLHYQGSSTREIRAYFLGFYPNENIPSREAIRSIIKKFENTACANKTHRKKDNREPEVDETEFNVVAKIQENPRTSVRIIAHELDINKSQVMRILKKHKFHSYKIQLHQDLSIQDMESRQSYSEIIFEKVNINRNFLKHVCFTDECTFFLKMRGNPQNDRFWSQNNPRLQKITRTQYPLKVNVWAGILGQNIIGPFFIDGTLNGEKYLEMLHTYIGPTILEVIGNYDRQIYYQQDGCPAHNTVPVREFLNNTFPDTWIGNAGPIHWPARSPDLSPLDFYFWGKLKTNLYQHGKTYDSLEELKAAIIEECGRITPRELKNVRDEIYNRLNFCLVRNGGHFEYLL